MKILVNHIEKSTIVYDMLGLAPDGELQINQSSVLPKSYKPYYNILLDDRAGLEESYEIFKICCR